MKRLLSLILTVALILSLMPTVLAASDEATEAATALYELGLFQGTGTDANGNPNFDLDRTPTRSEAVTMLVRLLGKENEATSGTWTTPFTDVAEWAKPYVGYAYANGLTTGTSATTYSGDDTVTVSQYLTFVLRALGYSSGTDFQWDKAWELSDSIGLTAGEYNADTSSFTRGDLAIISYSALSIKLKGQETILKDTINIGSSTTSSTILPSEWIGYNQTDAWQYVEAYSFQGNQYSCAFAVFDENDNRFISGYEEGTYTYQDGILTLTRTVMYTYEENSSAAIVTQEVEIMEYEIVLYEIVNTAFMNKWVYYTGTGREDFSSTYTSIKEYVMDHVVESETLTSEDSTSGSTKMGSLMLNSVVCERGGNSRVVLQDAEAAEWRACCSDILITSYDENNCFFYVMSTASTSKHHYIECTDANNYKYLCIVDVF